MNHFLVHCVLVRLCTIVLGLEHIKEKDNLVYGYLILLHFIHI